LTIIGPTAKSEYPSLKITRWALSFVITRRTFDARIQNLPGPFHLCDTLFCDELTAFCPTTAQPDFYCIIIGYTPQEVCLETEFLKLYFQSFRDERIFAEQLTAKISDDLIEILHPSEIKIELTQRACGGSEITAIVHRAFNSANQEIPI
jgi:7-cyano-7-deazaguanine reductase